MFDEHRFARKLGDAMRDSLPGASANVPSHNHLTARENGHLLGPVFCHARLLRCALNGTNLPEQPRQDLQVLHNHEQTCIIGTCLKLHLSILMHRVYFCALV